MRTAKEHIRELLAKGLSQAVVASIVGVDPSYVSQLMGQDEFAAEVSEGRALAVGQHLKRDERLDSLEDGMIGKVEEMVKSPFMFRKPMEAVRALQIVNGLKRRASNVLDSQAGTQGTVVMLTMPKTIINNFYAPVLDINQNVVKIGDTDLITVQSAGMLALASQEKAASARSLEQVGSNHYEHSSNAINSKKISFRRQQGAELSLADI
jgi:transcriptional regulator with XRE-family HTH domain